MLLGGLMNMGRADSTTDENNNNNDDDDDDWYWRFNNWNWNAKHAAYPLILIVGYCFWGVVLMNRAVRRPDGPIGCCFRFFYPPCVVQAYDGCGGSAVLAWLLCCLAWPAAIAYSACCWRPRREYGYYYRQAENPNAAFVVVRPGEPVGYEPPMAVVVYD